MKNYFDLEAYSKRRTNLINLVKDIYPKQKGLILLFSNFEDHVKKFKQESSFSYFTGINEPASVLALSLENRSEIFLPNNAELRAKWVSCITTKTLPKQVGIDQIVPLGKEITTLDLDPFFTEADVEHLLKKMEDIVKEGGCLFVINPKDTEEYLQQKLILNNLCQLKPALKDALKDISPLVAVLRSVKSKQEIEAIYKAIEITAMAQEAAQEAISAGKTEAEIEGAINYVYTASGSVPAFPSIVGSGKNSTVLHYNNNDQELQKGDLVVVDIGADFKGYSADITRTYPVSGKFTDRQKEIYNIVLETQEFIASIAKPGIWLKNPDKPEESLHHIAKEFLRKKGYDQYMPHGLGHYLGMNTHDVGDYKNPLEVGNVFTIEPGIYIPEENLGVRIEDDYWVVEDGVVCLSENIPKTVAEIEKVTQE